MATHVHELPHWPSFRWDETSLAQRLPLTRHRRGRLIGRMEALGFDIRAEAAKLVQSSPDTALRDVNDLISKSILVREPGGGRSTSDALTAIA